MRLDIGVNAVAHSCNMTTLPSKGDKIGLVVTRINDNYEVAVHMNSYCDFLVTLGYTRSEAYQLLFMILELVSTLCYTAIVLHQPDDIEQLKPMLFTTIRKMIERS